MHGSIFEAMKFLKEISKPALVHIQLVINLTKF